MAVSRGRSTWTLGADRVLARYLETLATIQFFRSERGINFSDDSAFFIAAQTTTIIPIIHALTAVATMDVLARSLDLAFLATALPRALACAPFLAAIVFLNFNTGYVQDLRLRIRADPPEALERRRRQAFAFAKASYICGLAAFAFLVASHALSQST